jgi:hypothetical protein
MRHEAIRELYANVVTIDDTAGAFDKDGKAVSIDEDAVTAKANELATANAYVGKRLGAYPQLAEQFDMLFRDIAANKVTTDGELYKALAKVKSDNPKP